MTDQGKTTLANQLTKFSEIPGALSQDLLDRLVNCTDLKGFLKSKPFLIHKSCYDKFNKQKYERALRRKRPSSESSDLANLQPMKTRHRSGETIDIGKMVCMHCDEPDKFDPKSPDRNKGFNLCAAAGKWESPEHVEAMTEETKMMAAVLGDTKVLALVTSDLRAAERYYHPVCRRDFKNRYNYSIK